MSRSRTHSTLRATTLGIVAAGGLAVGAGAQPTIAEDLFAVITLQGKPCGEVLKYTKLGENDYEVTCKSGDRYRVRIEKDRVVIEER